MIIRKSVCITICAAVVICGMYLCANINRVITTSSEAVIEREIENANSYGQLYMSFVGADEGNVPKILINGVKCAEITDTQKTIDIVDRCVLELDTRGIQTPIMLQIDGRSENVLTDCVGRVVTGMDDIQNIGTFVIDKGDRK